MAKFLGKLYGHQVEGVDFALSTPYHINGFEMGLGKTATSLAVACKLGAKTLVVCPAFLRNNWLNEIEKFTEGLDITVTSYTQLHKLGVKGYDFIIADEAHYLKNHKAKRTGAFHELIVNEKPTHLMLMSGTPIKNRVSEFWSLLQLCYYGGSYDIFKPFFKLYFKFCHSFSYERTFEVNGIPIVRFDGVKNAEALKSLIAPVYLRKRADDVLDLPDIVNTNIFTKNAKKYDAKLKEAFDLFQIKDPAYMSLKSANALAKIGDTKELVKDILEQDKKVVVFTCHRESCRQLAKKLKCDYIDGSIAPDKRQAIIDKFNDRGSVLIATIGAASTGFNLTSANYMVFNDLPFVPADLEQARKRIHRIGQDLQCFYYYVFSSDTDKELFEMINRKTKDIEKVYK